MGTARRRLASLVGGLKRRGLRLVGAIAFSLTAILITGTPPSAETEMKRAVLGTIVRPGPVEVANQPKEWTPGSNGTPVLEDSELRTGSGETTLVALGKHGVIGLREQSHLSVGKTDQQGLPLALDGESSLSFRLPLTSDLTIFTDAAVIKAPGAEEMPVGDTSVQGVITQEGKETTVSVIRGRLRVRNRSGEQFVWVGSGEQATMTAGQETPRIALMTEAAKEETTRRLGVLGFLGSSTGLKVAGATTALVGVALGTAAATGAFSSNDSSGDTVLTAQGSPYIP